MGLLFQFNGISLAYFLFTDISLWARTYEDE